MRFLFSVWHSFASSSFSSASVTQAHTQHCRIELCHTQLCRIQFLQTPLRHTHTHNYVTHNISTQLLRTQLMSIMPRAYACIVLCNQYRLFSLTPFCYPFVSDLLLPLSCLPILFFPTYSVLVSACCKKLTCGTTYPVISGPLTLSKFFEWAPRFAHMFLDVEESSRLNLGFAGALCNSSKEVWSL